MNSPLMCYTKLSPNNSGPRNHVIDTISIHCMAGNMSIESAGNWEAQKSTAASSNYGIGSDGRIALYVDEANRSWCTSSPSNDHRAITIEVANDGGEPDWPVSSEAYNSLIKLLVDICKRNGIKKLLWKADPKLIGQVDKQNMTVHRWFANKACPGNYLFECHKVIAEEVNAYLEETEDEYVDFAKLTDDQVDQLLNRMNARLKDQTVPEWAEKDLAEAVTLGITDGKNPCCLIPRYQAAIMAKRAKTIK